MACILLHIIRRTLTYRTVLASLKSCLDEHSATLHLQKLATPDLTRISLSQEEIPTRWYNIQADLIEPLPPPLDPGTKQPINPASLDRIFAKELIRQEISSEQNITIPETVRDAYIQIGRPTPLVRARRLEKYLKTPAKIFYKAEYLSPTGSHKPNTALAQAYYSSQQLTKSVVTVLVLS